MLQNVDELLRIYNIATENFKSYVEQLEEMQEVSNTTNTALAYQKQRIKCVKDDIISITERILDCYEF